jgi:hypothetical protein
MKANARELSYRARQRYYSQHYSNLPTVDDIREATASSTNDIIRQVLTGQAVYYGYEVVWEPDNNLPVKGNDSYAKIEANTVKHNSLKRIKHLRKSLDEQINQLFGNKLTAAEIEEKKRALGL